MNKIIPNLGSERSTDRLLRLLVGTAHGLEKRYEEALAPVGLTGPKFGALSKLVQAGSSLSLGELAERLTCVRSNITQLVDRLEADGLVERSEDPADRRTVRAGITELGLEKQIAGAKMIEKLLEEIASSLKGFDLDAFERVLNALGSFNVLACYKDA